MLLRLVVRVQECLDLWAGAEGLRGKAPVEFRESDANCLEIGLINNMPDAALEATERQFVALLEAAAEGLVVRLTLYGLGDRNRGLLYGAVGVTVLTLTATRLMWETAIGTAAWFVLLGAAIYAGVYVYRASREY